MIKLCIIVALSEKCSTYIHHLISLEFIKNLEIKSGYDTKKIKLDKDDTVRHIHSHKNSLLMDLNGVTLKQLKGP